MPDAPLAFIQDCIDRRRIHWTYHVRMRSDQRGLTTDSLMMAISTLEIIERYPRDKYLPSFLVRGEWMGTVFHAHLATDVEGDNIRVVTMYVPDAAKWDAEFRVRRIR